jgi:hypothetical protein
MAHNANCSCIVAQYGTYLVDEEWAIDPNVWYDVNNGLIATGHGVIVALEGSGPQILLNQRHHCWVSQSIRAVAQGIGFDGDTWVRCYVAAKRNMSRWLAVEMTHTQDGEGNYRCNNLRVLDTETVLFEWRTPHFLSLGQVQPEAAYDAEQHRMFWRFNAGSWFYTDPPGSPSDFGRYAGFGVDPNSGDVTFTNPIVRMHGTAADAKCPKGCGVVTNGNICDPTKTGMGPMYEEPELGGDDPCGHEIGWQTEYLGADDPWTTDATSASYAATDPENACPGSAGRVIRVHDCDNSITLTITTGGHHAEPLTGEPLLARVDLFQGEHMGDKVWSLEVREVNTTEELVIEGLPLGDCLVVFAVATVTAGSCNALETAELTVDMVGAVWMEETP